MENVQQTENFPEPPFTFYKTISGLTIFKIFYTNTYTECNALSVLSRYFQSELFLIQAFKKDGMLIYLYIRMF